VRAVGDPPVVLAERAGVHRARVPGGPDRLVLASLTNDAESDVGRQDGDREWPATAAADTTTASGRVDLSWWFYALAAALLALEALVWGMARGPAR
jgi:hypothetical protein